MTESLPLTVENLTFQYRRRSKPAIEKINFSVQAGQVILIAGSSGCGKTTLMRCINGLIPHTYSGEMIGDIHLFGKSVTGLELAEISQTVGTLLQDPERQILGSYVMLAGLCPDRFFNFHAGGRDCDEIRFPYRQLLGPGFLVEVGGRIIQGLHRVSAGSFIYS